MSALLGATIEMAEATKILTSLGFEIRAQRGEGDAAEADVTTPTFRPDIGGEADLVDEVMRIRGMASIPTVLPRSGRRRRAIRASACAPAAPRWSSGSPRR